jgi:hypothetical protein
MSKTAEDVRDALLEFAYGLSAFLHLCASATFIIADDE